MSYPSEPKATAFGYIPFNYKGRTFQTYYRIFGTITNGTRPLILLHGGPGIRSAYLDPYTELHSRYGITVILYDQVGCGDSLPFKNTPEREEFDKKISEIGNFSIDLYEVELDNVLRFLKVNEDYALLGHSWGGMLAASYAINYQPKGLKNIIFANSLARMKDWYDASLGLLVSPEMNFPRKDRNIMKFAERHEDAASVMTPEEYRELKERNITLKSKEYSEALDVFLRSFVLRVDPWPASWNKAAGGPHKSPVSGHMWGPAWCKSDGTLKDFDVRKDLHLIKAKTLVFNGHYEQAQDSVVKPFVDNIKGAQWVRFENSSHCPHYEEPDKCFEVIKEFLHN